ncbi:metal ABC transporter ATP-binding protein [Corynebacterium uterequi]|uniref:ATPase component of Mn/Zn ABC-type transporter n=1 Tax=Corynebacterium uterequi TaxID=1072256 RepID=A0A0G3HAT9_9CORY|nr:metal ABC transporter ATP-binding protein [Corynebacterium uterequi]AKK10464.1 ATPase component of Mn/Zn ABC-type transporter [Corynebacterium uterequi]
MNTVAECRNLTVDYGTNRALDDVSVTIPEGLVTGIIGPNGSGKSTLLKAMLGLTPATGDVLFFGGRLDDVRRRVGYMPQSASVDWDFPITVRDVVLMGTYGDLGWFRRPGAKHKAIADEAMEHTGIADLARRQIGQLSGGQRQRVFLARTLAQKPDLLVMDEPFAGIDAASEAAILKVLRDLKDKSIVLVHHDLGTVRDICDGAIVLKAGRLVASGPQALDPEVLERAYDIKVA